MINAGNADKARRYLVERSDGKFVVFVFQELHDLLTRDSRSPDTGDIMRALIEEMLR